MYRKVDTNLNFVDREKEVEKFWKDNKIFEKSMDSRKEGETYTFYDGPPTANGKPHIGHVLTRVIKDMIPRYRTMKGYMVPRKAGWDTHGLPVELEVEKKLGLDGKEQIEEYGMEPFIQQCKESVWKYKGMWEDFSSTVGFWADMEHPYVTYDNNFIESEWWALKEIWEKGLLYKGFKIVPYCPRCGTPLSSQEVAQGYKTVKERSAVVRFKVVGEDAYFLAWTTTPWTLPSNTALAVGDNIEYVRVKCLNPYTQQPQTVILAKELLPAYFTPKMEGTYSIGERIYKGSELVGIRYRQLIDWVKPMGDAFRVISGDYVTTVDGTGIVHIAPTFGADDDRVGKQAGIVPMYVVDRAGKNQPMVDRRGRLFRIEDMDPDFVAKYVDAERYREWAGRFVKNAYDPSLGPDDPTLDIDIAVMLKGEGKAFKIEKHTHSYPHCWRTDKPVLYYPLDSWFIRTTALRERLMELNDTIDWKPASTGTGRFGKWLEGLVDWNLSRSRFWGTPLPIWATEDRSELKCIGSVAELRAEAEKAVAAGVMKSNPLAAFREGDFSEENYNIFDLHRPYVDDIVLVSDKGEPMRRESDLIDVWFDSGAMPYAQVHYPFEISREEFLKRFPADFIAEGVDQTRGWFFTLHALAAMLFDSVAFRNIISNGLVLDKNGNKMSKRLGNAVDPFDIMDKYGPDAVRWYMISNSQPWDNLKFDPEGVDEVRRKFFGTLYNTYSFFALYANVDGFNGQEPEIPVAERPEIDRWIISLLNTLVREVSDRLEDFDPTPAARLIQEFVGENLSNWYVRLNRKRFWGGGMSTDKLAAYQTLYTCLETVTRLMAPFAPFMADRLFGDLNAVSGKYRDSVHLCAFPTADASLIDGELEDTMSIAQRVSSMVLALRRKVNIKVRQPLTKILIPVLDEKTGRHIEKVRSLIMNEVNVKEVELITNTMGLITKRIKPNFKTLGPRYGKQMKQIAALVASFSQERIAAIEANDSFFLEIDGRQLPVTREDFEITSEDMPGWLVATEGKLTVALDVTVTETLLREGIARELINRIQNIRKESGFEVTDKIRAEIGRCDLVEGAVTDFGTYIASQTLAVELKLADTPAGDFVHDVDIDEHPVTIAVTKATA